MRLLRFFEKTKGSISVFLTLVMLPMFTCAGLIVDGARVSSARTAVMGAGDLAMNAALSEYDQVLQDVYGLFAMSESIGELENNVKLYFENTINNTGVLQGSDSYTRSFINSIGSMFSTDEISFDNIIDTESVSFDLVEVKYSALANPNVLERQIIEYMKYRGPISLGSGLLTKLNVIGETSKQTKVIEAKVDYEKKLDTVQDACETAYKAINTYNTALTNAKYTGDYLTQMNNDLAKAKDSTSKMTEYIIAYKSPSFKVDSLSSDSNLKKSVEKEIDELEGDNINMQAYELIKEKLKPNVEFEVDANGNYTAKKTQLVQNLSSFGFGPGDTLNKQTQYVLSVKQHMDIFTEVYTYLILLDDYYDELTKEEQTQLTKENAAYNNIVAQISFIAGAAKNQQSQWKNPINQYGSEASAVLYNNWYKDIETIQTSLDDAIDALESVLKKVDELDSVRITWGNRVDDLSDGEIKTSMEGDYANSAKDVNAEAVNSLIELLKENKTHFTKIKEKLDSVKYYDLKICVSNYSSIDYSSRYSSIPTYEINAANDLSDRVNSAMGNYVNADVKTGVTPPSAKAVTEEEQFYKFLKNTCSEVEGEITKEEKEKAKSDRTNLINAANTEKPINMEGITSGNYVTGSGLTEEIQNAIDGLAIAEAGAEVFRHTSIDSGGSNNSMANQAKSNLSSSTSLLDQLGKIAEIAVEKVYLEEYMTEMFSCYTTVNGDKDTISLSKHDLTTDTFAGSEVEYILYGKGTVEENLNAAKASVFGFRFAMNSVYALTSSDTRTPALTAATAIAGWTGFGVPIVQTVILLAWSLAESMMDMNQLLAGEAVALYKSRNTWVLSINGALKNGAEAVIDDIFTKIEEVTVDSISSLEDSVNGYVENTTAGVVDSVKSTIMTSVESLAMQIVGETNYNLTEADIGDRVDKMISSISTSAEEGSVIHKAMQQAVGVLSKGTVEVSGVLMSARNYIVSTIYSAYTQTKEGAVSAVSEAVESMLNRIANSIQTAITDTVSAVGESLKNEVSQVISAGGDQVKENVTAVIENYIGDIGGSNGANSVSVASGFSLTYKEYLKVFTMISLVVNKTAMLKRCAEMIQANVAQQNGKFNIAKAYTLVEANATISIRTTFFDVPVDSGVDENGETTYELDFSNIGTGRQEIDYVGILGY